MRIFAKEFPAAIIFFYAFSSFAFAHDIDYAAEVAVHVDAANWAEVKTVTVELDEYSFTPDKLTFKSGDPYKLEIKNVGEEKHYFVATVFFKAIATKSVDSNTDGAVKAAYLTALEILPGRSLDLYFVPVVAGDYRLVCIMKGHEDAGMVGTLITLRR